jgi:hypothetical protein
MYQRHKRWISADKFILAAVPLFILLIATAILSPASLGAILIVLLFGGLFLVVFRVYTTDKSFISILFIAAVLVRIAVGVFIQIYDLRGFFGGDSITYDNYGTLILNSWLGVGNDSSFDVARATFLQLPGWGMSYLVAAIYFFVGRNIFAAQCFCGVVGAAIAPMAYYCSDVIFANRRLSRIAAIIVAFFPAMIIWTSQLLKDGLIIFLLVLAMTMVIQLQRRVNALGMVLLGFALFGILSLRFYIFYPAVMAAVGSFIIGISKTNNTIISRIVILTILGVTLTYFGVARLASTNLDRFGNLAAIQNSRLDLAQSAASGFGSDVDVSTPEGAILALPIGLTYLLLAPFPWQAMNLRQGITVPDTILWWVSIPLIISGLWYSIRHRLRNVLPVLVFTILLTLSYAIFQGNVGTAYRQRAQIQVFLFMFAAAGLVIRLERRDDRAALAAAHRRAIGRRSELIARQT